jgi:alpha-glucosidase
VVGYRERTGNPSILFGRKPQEDHSALGARWWKHGIIYQIYPRSFQDTDGDGIGDLEGIISRLGYLTWLGVDPIWVSPIYPSSMADFGYDITDDCDIDPVFSDLPFFSRLLGEAHRRRVKVIMDLVPNHTSDQHPWFMDGRVSRRSGKRDWDIWRDRRATGGPPNKWMSNFGGLMENQTGAQSEAVGQNSSRNR